MRRHINTRGPKQHYCEGEERDRVCGVPTRLLDEMSTRLSQLLIEALPNTDSGFPFFVQMCGQNRGRVSEFEFEGERFEVRVLRMGPKGSQSPLDVLAETAQAYLDINCDEGILEEEEKSRIAAAIAAAGAS